MPFALKEETFTMELKKKINRPNQITRNKKIKEKLKRMNSMIKKIRTSNQFRKVVKFSLKIRKAKTVKFQRMKNMSEY